jgi:hypothetical protein
VCGEGEEQGGVVEECVFGGSEAGDAEPGGEGGERVVVPV